MNENTNYNPPCYFWVAVYEDGTALPEFDPNTGEENLYSEVQLDRLKSIGWYPFTEEMASKIEMNVIVKPSLSPFVLRLSDGERPIIVKRQTIKYGFNPVSIFDRGRSTLYLLGLHKGEERFILFIDEEGGVEISTDFNYK